MKKKITVRVGVVEVTAVKLHYKLKSKKKKINKKGRN